MKSLETNEAPKGRPWMLIIWPAFLTACLLQALIFALIDPADIHWPSRLSQPTRQSVYSVAFFCFWLITMACSSLVLWLAKPNQKPDKKVSDTAVS